jgi:hypothetical protein
LKESLAVNTTLILNLKIKSSWASYTTKNLIGWARLSLLSACSHCGTYSFVGKVKKIMTLPKSPTEKRKYETA